MRLIFNLYSTFNALFNIQLRIQHLFYIQSQGTVVLYSLSLLFKILDTEILLMAVVTLELEMDYPSETSLCTDAPSPTDTPSPMFS